MSTLTTKKISVNGVETKTQELNPKISSKQINVQIAGSGTVAIRDHAKLSHLEWLNSGHTGFAGIEFGTTAEWNAKLDYRPPAGMLVVYTDFQVIEDEQGNKTYVPSFKIGDGNAYLIDKPFIGAADSKLLQEHIEDTGVHVQPGEREFWNNKLNYVEPEVDLLEFTRN